MTKKRNLHPCCFLVVLAIFFMTSQALALLIPEDVANQVKEAMRAGETAEDAVKLAVTSAIAEGMSAKDAAAAATRSAVEVALTSDADVNAAIQGAVAGATDGTKAAGQNVNAGNQGACVAVISATAARGADIQLAAWMAVSASVKHAVQHNRDIAVATCTAIKGVMTGAVQSRLGSEKTARVVSGCTKGAMAAAIVTGQDTKAMATGVQNCVYSTAKTLGLGPSNLAMVAAKAASAADAIPPEGKLPSEIRPTRRVQERPEKVRAEDDPIEIVPDPAARATGI